MNQKAIKAPINHKLLRAVYLRIGEAYPLVVGEPVPEETGLRRIGRMLGRLGVAEPPPGRETVTEAIHAICAAMGEDRTGIEGKLRAFTTEGPGGVCMDTPACEKCEVSGLCRSFPRRPTIKDMPASERPRERLLREGPEALSDSDLLGIIIRGGTQKESAVDLARRLLAAHGNFRRLASCSAGELTRVKGIGPAKAAQIKAAFEIAKRFASIDFQPGQKFTGSEQVFAHYRRRLQDAKEEQFIVVLLDTQNKFIRDKVISIGSLDSSLVHPREVLAPAIRESAAAMIFVHNHPSGNKEPSQEDMDLTKRLVEAARIVGIRVLDHIIVADSDYESMAARGML